MEFFFLSKILGIIWTHFIEKNLFEYFDFVLKGTSRDNDLSPPVEITSHWVEIDPTEVYLDPWWRDAWWSGPPSSSTAALGHHPSILGCWR